MSRAAVICEFNPFHNGHKFLIEKIKAAYADEVVCIMSGNFVQRGDIAVTDKYARAQCALENGADMVVELPTVYALAPAERFAAAGVAIAAELKCDLLCFGVENSIEELYDALHALDVPAVQERIAAGMRSGAYYPRALGEAVDSAVAEIIRKPNNILALEYIRACRLYGLTPVGIERRGVMHDAEQPVGAYASASAIRAMIARGEDITAFSPMTIERPCFENRIEPILLYKLKSTPPEEIAAIAGVSEGLNFRIAQCSNDYNSIEEILSAVKTKRYTMARLRRILYGVCLEITEEMQERDVPYIRVLGVKADKKHLIASRTLPLIVDVRRGYDSLGNSSKEIFDVDLRACAAYNAAGVSPVPLNEFSQGLIVVG